MWETCQRVTKCKTCGRRMVKGERRYKTMLRQGRWIGPVYRCVSCTPSSTYEFRCTFCGLAFPTSFDLLDHSCEASVLARNLEGLPRNVNQIIPGIDSISAEEAKGYKFIDEIYTFNSDGTVTDVTNRVLYKITKSEPKVFLGRRLRPILTLKGE